MPARDSGSGPGAQDYRTFRGKVLLDETIASVETVAVPDPNAGRKVDQHLALTRRLSHDRGRVRCRPEAELRRCW